MKDDRYQQICTDKVYNSNLVTASGEVTGSFPTKTQNTLNYNLPGEESTIINESTVEERNKTFSNMQNDIMRLQKKISFMESKIKLKMD
jgi:hypothetical protein